MNAKQRDCPYLWPLETDNIRKLAQLIKKTLLHFSQYRSSCKKTYLNHLRIVNDCYHLVLIESNDQEHLCCYCTSKMKHEEQIQSYSFRTAEIINTVARKICLIDYPWFYPQFLIAVKDILSTKFCYQEGDLKTAQMLLKKIMKRPARIIL